LNSSLAPVSIKKICSSKLIVIVINRRKTKIRNLFVIVALFAVVGFAFRKTTTQAENKPSQSSVERPQKAEPGPEKTPVAARSTASVSKRDAGSSLDAATKSNQQLQTDLEWNFGGKAQHGWTLYTPLISHMINSQDDDVASSEFAQRLLKWQARSGIQPTGVLDSETWSRMITGFQARRLGNHGYANESNLVTIPTSDCYDPDRDEALRRADRETYLAYKHMIQEAAKDSSLGLQIDAAGQLASSERLLKVVSAFRSRDYQEQLRQKSPTSGRAGLAVNSPHFTGRALDLYVGGDPVSTKDDNRALQTRGLVYRWLVKNAARFGFQPYFYEPWHWEYVGKAEGK